jgi:hypothetical protein
MKGEDIIGALDGVGKKWTRQVKAEERHSSARRYRGEMWKSSRRALKDICFEHMTEAWDKASDHGRLPTHWRQVFYVMRPICDEHPDSDRPLIDARFKRILEDYLAEYQPGWDILRGARGIFKEPHSAKADNGLPMSTANVRDYLGAETPSADIERITSRYPTAGARNRYAAVLICEKEGFDELLEAEQIPARYDLALMATKGVSAFAARDLAGDVGVQCFTLHDLDKNGFVMAGGFSHATDIGIRMEDVEKWGLDAEEQSHDNPESTRWNLISNGATGEEADFVAGGQRVELNMFTSEDLVAYVEQKLQEHNVEKVIPGEQTLELAWQRAHRGIRVNAIIDGEDVDLDKAIPSAPGDLAEQIKTAFDEDDTQSWDEALWAIATVAVDDEDTGGAA